MKYGVLGTGMVGQAISNRLAELGHEVMIGTREPSKSADKLKSKHEAVKVGTFEEAAAFGEVLFNATSGSVSNVQHQDCPMSEGEREWNMLQH